MLVSASAISLKSSSSISPTRISTRFIHVSWADFQCRTNLALPFDASDAASNKRCVGKIKCFSRND
jgi:hypothetical protein